MMAGMSIDMFIEPEKDPRTEPPTRAGELATLAGFLRWQRGTLELKCSGLDAEAMARRSVEPSMMSLLGLVRHLADVERSWFRKIMAGQDVPSRYRSEDQPTGISRAPGRIRPWSPRPGRPGGTRSRSRTGSSPRHQTSTGSGRCPTPGAGRCRCAGC